MIVMSYNNGIPI